MLVNLFFFVLIKRSGGHLDVTHLLVENKADVDSQDNRKVSCLMAAFRKVLQVQSILYMYNITWI